MRRAVLAWLLSFAVVMSACASEPAADDGAAGSRPEGAAPGAGDSDGGAPPPGTGETGAASTPAAEKPASQSARPRTKSGTRPTTLPQLGRPDPNGRPVFVVGDSLTVGADPWLAGATGRYGWHPTVDARVSRRAEEGLAILRREEDGLPATVLVALGTNNLGASDEEVRQWVEDARTILGDGRRILWVNLHVAEEHPSHEQSLRINSTLARAARANDIELADWEQWAEDNGVTHRPDGIHYDDRNYRMRAAFYAEALGRADSVTQAAPSSTSPEPSSTSTTSKTLLPVLEVPS